MGDSTVAENFHSLLMNWLRVSAQIQELQLMNKLIQQVKRLIDYYTPRRCTSCGRVKFGVITRDTGTAYVNDALNYRTQCPCCHNREDKYWTDLWDEYRASQGV